MNPANHAANYSEPTGPMGWGDPELSTIDNRMAEAAMMESLPMVCTVRDSHGAGTIMPAVEARIRSAFKFDEGWDFRVAEELVAGVQTFQQNIGNCVGASHTMLLAARIAHEILAEGQAEEALGQGDLQMPFVPYSYGVGRLAGNMLGRGDGSYCGAQIRGTQEHGFLPCFVPGVSDYGSLPQSSSTVGRLFGRSRAELEKWMPHARPFDLVEAPKVQSADDVWELIVNKKIPLQICSGWGFRFKQTDANGINVYDRGGSWSHSMQLIAAFRIKQQKYCTVRNQWGKSHKDGQSFTIRWETLERWIPNSETIGIGEIQGLSTYATAA